MRFLIAIILTILLSFIAGLYLPWWSIAIAAFIAALVVYQKAGMAFLTGFLALLILWSALALSIDNANESILSARIGELLGIGNSPFLLVIITGFVGGIVAGFAAMTGSYLRRLRN
jgi:membrane protein implicated in regulation of membrane protease activity